MSHFSAADAIVVAPAITVAATAADANVRFMDISLPPASNRHASAVAPPGRFLPMGALYTRAGRPRKDRPPARTVGRKSRAARAPAQLFQNSRRGKLQKVSTPVSVTRKVSLITTPQSSFQMAGTL